MNDCPHMSHQEILDFFSLFFILLSLRLLISTYKKNMLNLRKKEKHIFDIFSHNC